MTQVDSTTTTSDDLDTLDQKLCDYIDLYNRGVNRLDQEHARLRQLLETMDNRVTGRPAELVDVADVRPNDLVKHWSWVWSSHERVALADHLTDGRVRLFFDDANGTVKDLWAGEQVSRVTARVRCCPVCGSRLRPLEHWCSRSCYEAENGRDEDGE